MRWALFSILGSPVFSTAATFAPCVSMGTVRQDFSTSTTSLATAAECQAWVTQRHPRMKAWSYTGTLCAASFDTEIIKFESGISGDANCEPNKPATKKLSAGEITAATIMSLAGAGIVVYLLTFAFQVFKSHRKSVLDRRK